MDLMHFYCFFPFPLVAQAGGGVATLASSLGLSPDLVALLGGSPRGEPLCSIWIVYGVVESMLVY